MVQMSHLTSFITLSHKFSMVLQVQNILRNYEFFQLFLQTIEIWRQLLRIWRRQIAKKCKHANKISIFCMKSWKNSVSQDVLDQSKKRSYITKFLYRSPPPAYRSPWFSIFWNYQKRWLETLYFYKFYAIFQRWTPSNNRAPRAPLGSEFCTDPENIQNFRKGEICRRYLVMTHLNHFQLHVMS